jgi:hypothetical protein
MRLRVAAILGALTLAAAFAWAVQSGPGQADRVLEPFKGVTTDGQLISGLFPIKATGVSTAGVKAAAERFLASLTPEQRQTTHYPVEDREWRMWNNVHRAARQGVNFKGMSEPQRERAYDLLRAGLSVKGFEKSRNIMRLNGHLADLISSHEEYGEGLYYLTVMGTPSDREPWGWQLDGHHLVVNYFVLGDQVVMTPTFMGSEPVSAESGPYAGTVVLKPEQDKGLALVQSLTAEQQKVAVVQSEKTGGNAQTQAFRDNVTLPYQGIRATALTAPQRALLVGVINEYIADMDDGHAKVKMAEVTAHLDDTYFSWVGGVGPDAVFYYRIQSPVILIEFDHQGPVALPGPKVPSRRHVHSVVRTPNGNDYGKDLLRQHLEQFKHDPNHGHALGEEGGKK